jgi:hypothetical protein
MKRVRELWPFGFRDASTCLHISIHLVAGVSFCGLLDLERKAQDRAHLAPTYSLAKLSLPLA